MGGSQSRQNVENIQTSINETINSTLNETNNSANCKSDVDQTLKIDLDNISISGNSNFNVAQTSKVNMMCFINNITVLSDNIKTELENLLENENSLKNVIESSGITLDSGQETELKLKVNQYIQNSLINNASNIINNSISLDQSASNTLLFNAGSINISDNSTFTLSQESVIDIISKTITENMIDTIIDETNTNVIDNTVDSETSIVDEGIDPVEAVSSMFSSWITWVAIGLIIIVPIGIYFFSRTAETVATDPNFNKTLQTVVPQVAQNATPIGRATTMAKGVTGGAKRYFNKTTIDFVLLLILSYIAIRVN